MPSDGASRPLDDPVAETSRLLRSCVAAGVEARALGGVAFALRLAGAGHPEYPRVPKDIDLVAAVSSRESLSALLDAEGYEPDREFNLQSGHTRLLFWDRVHERQLDVFLGDFEMCHVIPLAERLGAEELTIPLAELLLTKLQIVELNEKDRVDVLALLGRADVGRDDGALMVSAARVAELCGADWGLHRTVTLNLDRVRAGLARDDAGARIERNVERLAEAIDERPKGLRWRMRAKVGDRVAWYRSPQEVGG